MIKDKIIYFGYGSIVVGHSIMTLHITEIKPPLEVGYTIKKSEINNLNIIEKVGIYAELQEFVELQKALNVVNELENKQVKFKDYIFDFSNYNPKSIEVVNEHIKNAIVCCQIALAC